MESGSIAMKELTLDSVKAEIYARNNPTLTPVDIELHAEVVYRILELKKKHNAVILGHNYMEPLVFGLSEQNELEGWGGRASHLPMITNWLSGKRLGYKYLCGDTI